MKCIHIILIILIFPSCLKQDEKEELPAPKKYGVAKVLDFRTSQPLENATVIYYVRDADGTGTGIHGVTNQLGTTSIDYLYFDELEEIRATKQDYEQYCEVVFLNPVISSPRTIHLLKRDAHIRFHLINQPPVHVLDKLSLNLVSDLNFCSGQNGFQLPEGTMDTTITLHVVGGNNSVSWSLKRNDTLITDSSFTANAPLGDTLDVLIEY